MLPIKTILFPTDFSENTVPALDMATALARDYGAKLVIVHVIPPQVPLVSNGLSLSPLPVDLPVIRGHLRRVRPSIPSVTVEHVLVQGDEALGILQAAQDQRADLIVMGTHGRSGLGRLLMGSVAEKVLRNAPCPVVTVKRPIPGPTPAEPSPAREEVATAR